MSLASRQQTCAKCGALLTTVEAIEYEILIDDVIRWIAVCTECHRGGKGVPFLGWGKHEPVAQDPRRGTSPQPGRQPRQVHTPDREHLHKRSQSGSSHPRACCHWRQHQVPRSHLPILQFAYRRTSATQPEAPTIVTMVTGGTVKSSPTVTA